MVKGLDDHHVGRKLQNIRRTLDLVHNVRLAIVPPFFLLVANRIPADQRFTIGNRHIWYVGIVADVTLHIMRIGCVAHSLERRGIPISGHLSTTTGNSAVARHCRNQKT